MPLEDRDYVRGKHPPACTCKECVARRLGKESAGRYTHVPFGGGPVASHRGLSTADAERKGLIRWDGSKYVSPEPTDPTPHEERPEAPPPSAEDEPAASQKVECIAVPLEHRDCIPFRQRPKPAHESLPVVDAKPTPAEGRTEHKGRAWFGNEYFDERKRRWRKPHWSVARWCAAILVNGFGIAIITLGLYVIIRTILLVADD